MQVGAAATLQMTSAVTLEAWVYPTGNTNGTIISKEGEYMLSRLTDGTLRWALANSVPGWTWINSGAVLPLNSWSHVALSFNNGTAIGYVNGVAVHTEVGLGSLGDVSPTANDFRIGGRQSSSQHFKGLIDEVAVYNRALTAAEIGRSFASNQSSFGLPTGMTMNAVTGLLSGTPISAPGAYPVTVRTMDLTGCSGVRSYVLNVACPVVQVQPSTLPDGVQFGSYDQTVTATGGTAPYSWQLVSGALPDGVTLNASTGRLSGTLGNLQTTNFVLQATDANGCSGTRPFAIEVACPVLAISPGTLPAATFNAVYPTQTLTSDGGTAPYTYAITTGTLPDGMSLSTAGVLSGTPTSTPDSFVFEVRSTDASGCSTSLSYTLVVNCPVIAITSPVTLPDAIETGSYTHTFTSTGGAAPYSYSVVVGSIPPGTTLTNGGLLAGAPTTPGSSRIAGCPEPWSCRGGVGGAWRGGILAPR